MTRPCKRRYIGFRYKHLYFKPRAVPLRKLQEVDLSVAELEAIRLCDQQELEQEKAAKLMHISQSTLQRTLDKGRQKVADALVRGKAIRIIRQDECK